MAKVVGQICLKKENVLSMEKVNKDTGLNRQPATAERPSLSGGNAIVSACAPPQGLNNSDCGQSENCGEPTSKGAWLVEDILPLGSCVILAAWGGVGKSMMTLDLAIKVGSEPDSGGEQPMAFGHRVLTHGPVILLSAEDDDDELHRRAEGLGGVYPKGVYIVPLRDLGGAQPFFVRDSSGAPEVTQAWRELEEQAMDIRPVLIIIDSLASFVLADIYKNHSVGVWVQAQFRRLANATGACVLINHHLSHSEKPVTSGKMALRLVRGTPAIVDGANGCYVLWDAGKREARAMCKLLNIPFKAGDVVNGCLAKSNYPGDKEVQAYVRNDRGLLVPVVTNEA